MISEICLGIGMALMIIGVIMMWAGVYLSFSERVYLNGVFGPLLLALVFFTLGLCFKEETPPQEPKWVLVQKFAAPIGFRSMAVMQSTEAPNVKILVYLNDNDKTIYSVAQWFVEPVAPEKTQVEANE